MARSRHLPPVLTMFLVVGLATNAGAQSADQIINSLKPGTGMDGLTRGIRPIGPSVPADTAAPTTPRRRGQARDSVQTASETPSVSLTVDFETNSAELTPDAVHTLDHLGEALASPTLSKYRFRIEGHTDTVGTAAANKALSERRSQAVAAYIEKYFHVSPGRLVPVGMGEAGLLVPTPPQTAEIRNRRVQVVNIGA